MTIFLIALGITVVLFIGAYILGKWICNIINETSNIDFNFEEDKEYLN